MNSNEENMATVKVIAQVKYGRRFNYPANHEAEQFCLLIRGKHDGYAKSLTDRQLEIIRGLGFEVEQKVEVVRRNHFK
jgi:hypothetical protein